MFQQFVASKYWKKRKYLKFTNNRDHRTSYKLGRLVLFLLGLVAVHSLAMVYIENMSLGDAIWLTITTVTTVGYGDLSASTLAGRLVTTFCIYIFAISLLAQLAAEFFEHRMQSREDKRNGNWRWDNMTQHILIINTPDENTQSYLERFINQVRATPALEEFPIQILTRKFPNGLPESITKYGVVHFNGVAEDNECLEAVNVSSAKYIIILAKNAGDPLSDSLTFDVLWRIREIGTNAMIAAECSVDANRKRIIAAGADVVIRPVRAYPELLVRSIVAPGTETVLENLFQHDDDHMIRFDYSFSNIKWKDIIFSCIENDIGLPLAYIDETGVHTNPSPNEVCSGNGIISLVRDNQEISKDKVKACLAAA